MENMKSLLARRSAIIADLDASIAKLGALYRELVATHIEAAREIRRDESLRDKAHWANRSFSEEETARRFRIAIANAFADPATGRSLFGEKQDAPVGAEGFSLGVLYAKDTRAILGAEAGG